MSQSSSNILSNKYQIKNYFKLWYPGLVAFAQQFIKTESEAEDVVQNAFIKLFENFNGPKNIDSAKSFLYKSIRNECINIIKHEAVKRKHFLASEHESLSEKYFLQKLIEEETYAALTEAINELPEQCQKILILSLNGLKNNEIAEDLNISVNTVKTQKKRAYKGIKEKLQHVYFIVASLSGL